MSVNEPTVFLDMDGVLVDFFNAFAKLANVKHWKQMDPQRLQDVLNTVQKCILAFISDDNCCRRLWG